MKLYFTIVTTLLLFSNLSVQAQDLTTPESAVRSLLTGFCKGDIGEAINCIENAKYNSLLDPMGRSMKLTPYTFSLANVQSQVESGHATLTMQVTLQQAGADQIQQFTSTVKLHEAGGKWHVVVNRDGPFVPGKPDPVNAAVRALADPHSMETYLKTTHERERMAQGCVANLTALGTASLMLLHNHDKRYALNAESYQKFLNPYLPNVGVYRCPADHRGDVSYSFNANLVGIQYPSIQDPSIVVAIYEGKGGKLRFKHDGKAGVAFADGHVQMVTEEEAKALKWVP